MLANGGAWTSLNAIFNSIAAILLAGGVALILFALRPPRDLFLWLSLALAAIAIGNAALGDRRRPVHHRLVRWSRLSWTASACALLLYFVGHFVQAAGSAGADRRCS